MAHLLAATNPDAVDRINGSGRPMPPVGSMVVFRPRPGDVRRGRKDVPAVVLKVDESNRRLELYLILDADDVLVQEHVPEWVEGDRGWVRLPSEAQDQRDEIVGLREQVIALTQLVHGEFTMPKGESVLGLLDQQDERVGKLEDGAKRAAKVAKAKPVSAVDPAAEPEAAPRRRRLRGNRT